MSLLTLISGVVMVLGMLASAAWIVLATALLRRGGGRRLATLPHEAPGGGWPGLAVIMAARDEEASIEEAMRSLLAQDYPGLEVIGVDDRSTDATGAILDRLAREDPRLRAVHVETLPAGWLGKTHALQMGADSTPSEWLLFADADVMFAPQSLRRAVAWAVSRGAAHVTVVPEFRSEGVGERLFLALFGLAFTIRASGDEPAAGRHLGIGAFNLVRADAFRGIDGFRHLSLSVDDDNRLAQALVVAGYRARPLQGAGAVSVRWQSGLVGLIRGMEKNYFAFFDFRAGSMALACFAWLSLGMAPYAGLFVGPWWARVACAVGISGIGAILALGRPQTGAGWHYAALFPLSVALHVVAMIRSAWSTLRHGSVRWRDRRYPLDELRGHVVRRNAWLAELAARHRDQARGERPGITP